MQRRRRKKKQSRLLISIKSKTSPSTSNRLEIYDWHKAVTLFTQHLLIGINGRGAPLFFYTHISYLHPQFLYQQQMACRETCRFLNVTVVVVVVFCYVSSLSRSQRGREKGTQLRQCSNLPMYIKFIFESSYFSMTSFKKIGI